MAIYKIFPTKDASLYSQFPTQNTGLDEVLDISTSVKEGRGQTNRSLIQFSTTEIVDTIDNLVGSGTSFINSTILPTFSTDGGVPLLGTSGTYNNVVINGISSKAKNALATVIIDGLGEITSATITNTGSFYQKGELLKISSGELGANSLQTETTVGLKYADLDYGASLKISAAVVSGLSQNSTIEAFPISSSWNMGTGRFYDDPKTKNGCSWIFNDSSGSEEWQTSVFPVGTPYATASFSSSMEGGGSWYYADPSGVDYEFKQLFSYGNDIDINIDVQRSINQQYLYEQDSTTGQKNDGFIVKQTGSQEFLNNINTQSTFRYFSIDTNTIYPPMLELKWDDYNFNTGSSNNVILSQAESFISVYNNAGTYYSGSIARFRLAGIPKYPDVVFQTASLYTTNFYLPPQISYYSIKDTDTNEVIINFDEKYTKISADSTSNYFDVYMNGLEPERYYTILIKTTIDGSTKIFDEDIMFKVVNG